MCSAPGGKAIFAYRAFHPEILVCNEVIRNRIGALIDNVQRCQVEGAMVTNLDPSAWARLYGEAFDFVIVDAPCSGQSLLAKGSSAPGCFSHKMVAMCAGRQRRILGNAVEALRPGGHLLYMTCTYSLEENEKIVKWALEQFSNLEAVGVPGLAAFRSLHSGSPCYRLYPQSGIGAGAFTALLQKTGDPESEMPSLDSLKAIWRFGDFVKDPRGEGRTPAPEIKRPKRRKKR